MESQLELVIERALFPSVMYNLFITAILTPGILSQSHLVAPPTSISIVWVTETVTSHVIAQEPATQSASFALPPGSSAPPPLSTSISVTPTTMASPTHTTTTKLVTETAIVTVSATPPPTSPATETAGIRDTVWSAPPQMTDLSAFNISKFPGGDQNLAIVQGIPASASATDVAAASESTDLPGGWDNSSSVLQLLYPAHSINPGKKPLGGAQFYATPLWVSDARKITLNYSVFFPFDFDWVLAGKLPGLYGGHAGCSGGDDALNCFSTRLMWRKDGIGELYLYAPKDEQTEDLCADPQSVCDTTYGFSIGRGSFTWFNGAWTNVQQTVTLNTPGEQDGAFTLDVNGERVIDRNDIYYRSAPPPDDNDDDDDDPSEPPIPTPIQKPYVPGILGPLLGDLLGRSDPTIPANHLASKSEFPVITLPPGYQAQRKWSIEVVPGSGIAIADTVSESNAEPADFPSVVIQQETKVTKSKGQQPIGFTGLFFSTFFGGHEPRYATPRDQYVWFKDFAMIYNA